MYFYVLGNYCLTRVLPLVYVFHPDPINDHIMVLASLLHGMDIVEKLALLDLLLRVAKTKPSVSSFPPLEWNKRKDHDFFLRDSSSNKIILEFLHCFQLLLLCYKVLHFLFVLFAMFSKRMDRLSWNLAFVTSSSWRRCREGEEERVDGFSNNHTFLEVHKAMYELFWQEERGGG